MKENELIATPEVPVTEVPVTEGTVISTPEVTAPPEKAVTERRAQVTEGAGEMEALTADTNTAPAMAEEPVMAETANHGEYLTAKDNVGNTMASPKAETAGNVEAPAEVDIMGTDAEPRAMADTAGDMKSNVTGDSPEPSTHDPGQPESASHDPMHPESAAPAPEPGRRVRDYEAEWRELAEAHPEIVGNTLPQDIFEACVKSDQPPLRVYESMMLQRMQSEIERLKQENDRLRQNEANAQRAPVTGTLAGGATDGLEDPFVTAFRRYR